MSTTTDPDTALLLWLQLHDSAFPAGRLVHSQGLEEWLADRPEANPDDVGALALDYLVHGFAPLDATGTQLLFRFIAAAYERRALGIASHWAFNDWGRFLPEHTTTASLLDRLLHHAVVIVTEGESYRMRTRGGGPNT